MMQGHAGESGPQQMWDFLFPCEPVPEVVQKIRSARMGDYSGDIRDYLKGLSQYPFWRNVWDALSEHPILLIQEGRGINGAVDVNQPRPHSSNDESLVSQLAYVRRHRDSLFIAGICEGMNLLHQTHSDPVGPANWDASDNESYDNPLLGDYRQTDDSDE